MVGNGISESAAGSHPKVNFLEDEIGPPFRMAPIFKGALAVTVVLNLRNFNQLMQGCDLGV